MTTEKGIEKSGYLEVKQPSSTKGRKLKSWKKKWVVVHQMSDLANGKYNAKIDIYSDANSAKKSPTDKMTFVLENITAVQLSKSKTHPNAFEVVETEPVLVFSAASEQETATWMSIYRRIFQHDELGEFDIFGVNIISNAHAKRLNLEGRVLLSISSATVGVLTPDYKQVVQWKLSTIKRFYTEDDSRDQTQKLFIIETGPSSASGEGTCRFSTPEWDLILSTIRKNINSAISERQHLKLAEQVRERSSSTSTTTSEYHFTNLLANSDVPSGSCSDRSNSVNSLGSSVFTNGSNPDCSATPPLSPVSTSGRKLEVPPITSTPNLSRNIRSDSFNVTGSTISVVEDGYSVIKPGDEQGIKPRSGSVSSTNSTSSNRSDHSRSITRDSGILETRNESLETKSDSLPLRTVSNSFDSGFSNGSYDETTKRKGSDVDKAIAEETPDVKPDPSNIYQELDYAKVLNGQMENSVPEKRSRRHSTGDVEKDSDYAELDCRKGEDGTGIFSSTGLTVPLDIPPALPDRPASLRWSHSMRAKPNWKKRLSALLISGQSPGHSPERCESPVSHQKSPVDSPVQDNNIVSNHAVTAVTEPTNQSGSEEEHLYQSIPEVLASSQKKFATLPTRFSPIDLEPSHVASDIVLPTGTFSFDHVINSINSKTHELKLLDTIKPVSKPHTKSDPLIDFFFKDDGFEILTSSAVSTSTPSAPQLIIEQVPITISPDQPSEGQKPLMEFSSEESLPVISPTPAAVLQEGLYMDMTAQKMPKVVINRAESVEYIPPSEMKAAMSEGNLIDI
ncbi:hypothetical protein LOTGIDRAFT_155833 [Lottia gigantea]|uniref:PH domain-containing protein n=1 Tax=Lottia gigantea TaxID=225164 RepID=V3YXJ6_LOTGI|nr:hypothetical protein LOTGIDRAFT_155833 [Lottia gigantea]ESO82803.1 hypothetical protein LOTGIDRAFT_155833 [Lottia gigantea]